jgi:hypothetical protein
MLVRIFVDPLGSRSIDAGDNTEYFQAEDVRKQMARAVFNPESEEAAFALASTNATCGWIRTEAVERKVSEAEFKAAMPWENFYDEMKDQLRPTLVPTE